MIDEHYAKQALGVGVQLILVQKMSSVQPHRRRRSRLKDFDVGGCAERSPNLGLRHSQQHVPTFDSVRDSRRKLRILLQILLPAPRRSVFEPYVDARGTPSEEQRDYRSGGASAGMHSVRGGQRVWAATPSLWPATSSPSPVYFATPISTSAAVGRSFAVKVTTTRVPAADASLFAAVFSSGASCHRNGLLLPISSLHHHVILRRHRDAGHDPSSRVPLVSERDAEQYKSDASRERK